MKILSVLAASLLSFQNLQAAPQSSAPATSASSQAATLLRQSAAVLTASVALSDVTLTGSARRIAGSDDESGTAVFKALASGAARTDLSLSSGQRTEILSNVGANFSSPSPTSPSAPSNAPAGTWSGPDRVSHQIAFHNLLTEPAWFFPAFAIARRLSTSGYVATHVGIETHNGQAVEHLSVSEIAPVPNPPGGVSHEHLTQIDFFLDSTTLLPSAIAFNIHPDNNALLDIPVEIRFSDYRAVNGAGATGGAAGPMIPFHIQKFLNNSLLLDFQAETVALNTGLSASDF